MNNTLSISVQSEKVPHVPFQDKLRLILWNGRIRKHADSMLFGAEYNHENFFVVLKSLKEAVKDWQLRHQNEPILGINSGVCWPLNPERAGCLEPAFLEVEMQRYITHCGGTKGLFCAVNRIDDKFEAQLHDVEPMPKLENPSEALIKCSYWDSNIFSVAENLQEMVKASARTKKILRVSGIDDCSPCWPIGLGEVRYS